MAEPEKVKYARQVVAQQMLADAVVGVKLLWEDYPLLPEREFMAAEKLALQVEAPPAEQYNAAYAFLASLADNDEDSSRARGGDDSAPPYTPTEQQLREAALAGALAAAGGEHNLDVVEFGQMLDRAFAAIKLQAVADRDEAERLASVPCRWEMDHWTYFGHGDDYWMKCKLVGPHELHEDSDTGATWTNDTEGAHEL